MAWFNSQGNILSNIQGSWLQDYMLLFFDSLVICRHPRAVGTDDDELSENVRPQITIQNITKHDAVRLSGKWFVREKRPLLL